MTGKTSGNPETKRGLRIVVAALLLLPVFMYVSIMYKIMHYGP